MWYKMDQEISDNVTKDMLRRREDLRRAKGGGVLA